MSLLFFSTVRSATVHNIQKMIETIVVPEPLEIYRSVKALSQRLHQPRGDLRIAILSVSSHKELTKILSLKDLLEDLATILILPDTKTETVSKAHLLRPRFLTSADGDPTVIAAVMAKMLWKYASQTIR